MRKYKIEREHWEDNTFAVRIQNPVGGWQTLRWCFQTSQAAFEFILINEGWVESGELDENAQVLEVAV